MKRFRLILCTLVAVSVLSATAHAEPAKIVSWSDRDEAWYSRNRRFATAGKVLTLTGIAAIFAGMSVIPDLRGAAPGVILQNAGQLMWAGSDLRAANRMRRSGHSVRKSAGVVAVIGACVFSPLVWIAGPVQSMRLRDAHGEALAGPVGTGGGLQMRIRF